MRKNYGFTLLELMIVMVVVAVLMTALLMFEWKITRHPLRSWRDYLSFINSFTRVAIVTSLREKNETHTLFSVGCVLVYFNFVG